MDPEKAIAILSSRPPLDSMTLAEEQPPSSSMTNQVVDLESGAVERSSSSSSSSSSAEAGAGTPSPHEAAQEAVRRKCAELRGKDTGECG